MSYVEDKQGIAATCCCCLNKNHGIEVWFYIIIVLNIYYSIYLP